MSGLPKTWETLDALMARNAASAANGLNMALRIARQPTPELAQRAQDEMNAKLAAGRSALLTATAIAFGESFAIAEDAALAGAVKFMEPQLGVFVAECSGHVVRLPDFNKTIHSNQTAA